MTDKHKQETVTTVLRIEGAGIFVVWIGYYFILFGGERFVKNVDVIRKLLLENGLLHSRAFQYILFGLLYIIVFIMVVRQTRSQRKNIIIALICGMAFATQIMLTNLVFNYLHFQSRYASDYSLIGFFTSEKWRRTASQYGNIGEYLIHLGFMTTLLTMVAMGMALYREWSDIQQEETEELVGALHCHQNAVKHRQKLDANTLAIIELYVSGRVGRNGIIDYVEKLPLNQEDGWQQLLAMETLFENDDPSIVSAIQKRKRYGKAIRRKNESHCGTAIPEIEYCGRGTIIHGVFPKANKDLPNEHKS